MNINPKILGERIRAAREHIGLSQNDLAKLVEKDQRVISTIERGLRSVTVDELPIFAQALEVSLLYFFGLDEASLTDLETELLQQFQSLPSETSRQAAIEILRILSHLNSSL